MNAKFWKNSATSTGISEKKIKTCRKIKNGVCSYTEKTESDSIQYIPYVT